MKAVILAGVFRFIPNGTYFGMDTLITTLLEQRHELVLFVVALA